MRKPNAYRVYKAVRNYLFNELQVDKEYIDKLVEDRVNKRISHLLNSEMSEDVIGKLVKETVLKQITEDIMWQIRGKAREELLKNIDVKFTGEVTFDGKRLGMAVPNLLVKVEDGK